MIVREGNTLESRYDPTMSLLNSQNHTSTQSTNLLVNNSSQSDELLTPISGPMTASSIIQTNGDLRNPIAPKYEESFLFQPVPLGQKVQCRIIRTKGEGKEGICYELYMEGGHNGRFHLLSARRKKDRNSKYTISLNRLDSAEFDEGKIGKVKSNFLGSLFTIYGGPRGSELEQAVVMYDTNIFGLKGPRKLTLVLPGLTSEGNIISLPYKKGKPQLKEKFDTDDIKETLVLRNKSPQWNEDTQSYVLNFHNRVSHASVKNFQIVPDFDLDYVVIQFGRIGSDTFTMDFQYPLSALQAFGITLTSLDPKLICE